MWTKGRIVTFVILVLGLVDSLYLTYETIEYKHPNYCPLNGCEIIMSSPYSKFLGIPVSVLGLIWFSAALISLRWFSLYVVLWFLALSFVTYLIFTEVIILHTLCVYCTLAHVLALVSILPIIIERRGG